MPGKILKVLASEGAEVKSHQPLIIMEAMKMEYTLTAPRDGVVKSVQCKVDDQVEPGDQLVTLEEE